MPNQGIAGHRSFITLIAVNNRHCANSVVSPYYAFQRTRQCHDLYGVMIVGETFNNGAVDVEYFKGGAGFFISLPLMCLSLQCHAPCADLLAQT